MWLQKIYSPSLMVWGMGLILTINKSAVGFVIDRVCSWWWWWYSVYLDDCLVFLLCWRFYCDDHGFCLYAFSSYIESVYFINMAVLHWLVFWMLNQSYPQSQTHIFHDIVLFYILNVWLASTFKEFCIFVES